MILSRRSIFTGCSVAVAVVAPGCDSKPAPKNPMGMDFRDTFGPKPEVVKDQSGNLPVMQARPTFAYIVEFPCTVRVIELDSKKVVGTAVAKSRDIVTVDKKQGVLVDGNLVGVGPLNENLEYGIFCDRSK